MTERLSFSSPASSSHALGNQGLEKQESQEEKKKKRWNFEHLLLGPEIYIPASKSCDEGGEEGVWRRDANSTSSEAQILFWVTLLRPSQLAKRHIPVSGHKVTLF